MVQRSPQALTPDSLRQDAKHVLAFLRALDGALPGTCPEDLLDLLESATKNDLTLALLVQSFAREHQKEK